MKDLKYNVFIFFFFRILFIVIKLAYIYLINIIYTQDKTIINTILIKFDLIYP